MARIVTNIHATLEINVKRPKDGHMFLCIRSYDRTPRDVADVPPFSKRLSPVLPGKKRLLWFIWQRHLASFEQESQNSEEPPGPIRHL